MIPKGLSHTTVQNPTYEFQKRNICSIQENLSSIQNYQGLSFLPVTFTGLADLFPQLGSLHEKLCGNTMYLALMVQWQNTCDWCRGPGFKPKVWSLIFFSFWHPWETWFKSDFNSSFWDFICEIWNWGMASSFCNPNLN